MPMIETVALEAPFTQGDILRDLSVFVTNAPWSGGGEPKRLAPKACMILSRPCVVGHKSHVLVAAVERLAANPPRGTETFAQILGFLTDLRDGPESPDIFYLGQLPGYEGRYGAKLDSIHTVVFPSDAPGLAALAGRRIGRLHADFARDLHARVFRAVASLGFDDYSWFSTEDLRWLATRGQQELHDARSALEGARVALLAAQAQGIRNEAEKKLLEKGVTDAQTKLDALTALVTPFLQQLERREAGQG